MLVKLEGDFASQLASPDPKNRYLAVNSLSHPDAAQTAPLLKAIETEQEWVIKRRIVLALGRSSSPDAVPVLKRLAGDSKAKLSVAATKALASHGAEGVNALVEFAGTGDGKLSPYAIRALSLTDDPTAVAPLLKMTESNNPAIQSLAINALASRPTPEVQARLRSLLDGDNPQVLIAACKVLAAQKDKTAVPKLVELIVRSVKTLKSNPVREAAGNALDSLTDYRYGTFETLWQKALDQGRL